MVYVSFSFIYFYYFIHYISLFRYKIFIYFIHLLFFNPLPLFLLFFKGIAEAMPDNLMKRKTEEHRESGAGYFYENNKRI